MVFPKEVEDEGKLEKNGLTAIAHGALKIPHRVSEVGILNLGFHQDEIHSEKLQETASLATLFATFPPKRLAFHCCDRLFFC